MRINKKFTCAIIGMGRMGQRYIDIVKKLKINLVSIYDLNIDTIKKEIPKNKINKKIFTNKLSNLFYKKPDLIIIASTADSHFKLINKCAQNNIKYIFCEKPLTTSLPKINKIKEIISKKKIFISINHNSHFRGELNLCKKIANSKDLGGITNITRIGGNAGITMNGSHFISEFIYLSGLIPVEVSADIKLDKYLNNRGAKFKDFAGNLTLKNKINIKGNLNFENDSGHGDLLILTCRFGQLFLDLFSGHLYINKRKKKFLNQKSSKYGCPYTTIIKKVKISSVQDTTLKNLKNFLNGKNCFNLKKAEVVTKSLLAAYVSSTRNNEYIKINSLKLTKDFSWP